MYVLGINAFHGDASACLLQDGALVAAAEEERFRRVKHWAGFPSQAIAYCLDAAGLTLSDVAHLAVNSDPKANLLRKASFALRRRPELSLIKERLRNQKERASVQTQLQAAFPQQSFVGQVHQVEHHLCHLASCFWASPFESAVALSVDGFGDFASAAWGLGEGAALAVDERVYFPHSLGTFYQALTQYLGFPHYGDEYKVMGLAPYGKPTYLPALRDVVRVQSDATFDLGLAYFRHHKERIDYEWDGGSPVVGRLWTSALEDLLGPARAPSEPLEDRHRDIAHSVQAMYEEAFFSLLEQLANRYQVSRLTLAGGCAMNSVANGKVYRRSPFRALYVQSAAGDAGGAIGAAMVVARELHASRPAPMEHAFWGPSFADEAIAKLLTQQADDLTEAACSAERLDDETALCQRTADAVAQGKVVGWFQGRLEWGPRALGNRSIVCDPRRSDMKQILNQKIKKRESFRPFAPSILREHVAAWFEEDDDVPFMMKVFQIREDKRPLIPAVTHVDGSGRLQTVFKDHNPRYYRLIECFEAITGVPMVLNTSFNENEPVVCHPKEALDCFLRTKMDVLVLGDWYVERQSAS